MTSPTKKLKSKSSQNYLNWKYKTFRIFGGLGQLSSSIAWRVMAFSQNGQGYLLRDLIFCQNVFLAMIVEPETLESKSRALKQLCPSRGPHAAQQRVLFGPIYVFAVVKVSYNWRPALILIILNLTFLMQVSQQCHNYCLQCSTFASERPLFRTWEHQTCFLPRAPSNLVTSLNFGLYKTHQVVMTISLRVLSKFCNLYKMSRRECKKCFVIESENCKAIISWSKPCLCLLTTDLLWGFILVSNVYTGAITVKSFVFWRNLTYQRELFPWK